MIKKKPYCTAHIMLVYPLTNYSIFYSIYSYNFNFAHNPLCFQDACFDILVAAIPVKTPVMTNSNPSKCNPYA